MSGSTQLNQDEFRIDSHNLVFHFNHGESGTSLFGFQRSVFHLYACNANPSTTIRIACFACNDIHDRSVPESKHGDYLTQMFTALSRKALQNNLGSVLDLLLGCPHSLVHDVQKLLGKSCVSARFGKQFPLVRRAMSLTHTQVENRQTLRKKCFRAI